MEKEPSTAMVFCFIIGKLRIFLELVKNDLSGILYSLATINSLYFCILSFLFSIGVVVIVSLLAEKPSAEQLNGLTHATTVAEDKVKSRARWNKFDVVMSLIVVLAAFIYFSSLGVAGQQKECNSHSCSGCYIIVVARTSLRGSVRSGE
jgi:SSS family solute:Na+ symporter